MNRFRRLRTFAIAAAAAALIAPALVALAGPANAGSVKRHDVDIYKVEAFVELGGEYPDNEVHEHAYCHDGDVAIDGMWKVDSYETPNEAEGVHGDKRSVNATESWPATEANLTEKWHFWFINHGTGRATIKLFVTCLVTETGVRAGHSHDISVSERYSVVAGVTEAAEASPFDGCAPGELAVSPGFKMTDQSSTFRLYRSMPSADGRDWRWAFAGLGENEITFYLSCLKVRVSTELGNGDTKTHAHDLDTSWMPSTAGETTSTPMGDDQQVTMSAAWRDFAAVGAFDVVSPATTTYLGQDARGRKRDFKFWNAGPANADVKTAILSLHKRTSRQLKP